MSVDKDFDAVFLKKVEEINRAYQERADLLFREVLEKTTNKEFADSFERIVSENKQLKAEREELREALDNRKCHYHDNEWRDVEDCVACIALKSHGSRVGELLSTLELIASGYQDYEQQRDRAREALKEWNS